MITITKFLLIFFLALVLDLGIPRPGWMGILFPSLSFLLILFASLRWREKVGATLGFFTGIVHAGLFSEPLGLSSLVFMLVGYSSGKIAPFLQDSPRVVLFFFALIMIVGYNVLASTGTIILGGGTFSIRFVSAVAGGLVFALCLPPLMRFFKESER